MVALLLPLAITAALPGPAQAQTKKELGPKALRIVVEHLRSDDSDLRSLAAEILGEAGNKAASGTLRRMLSDRDKYVRIAAARALWQLGSPAGLKTITSIISDVPGQGPIPVTNNPLVELKIISQNKIRAKAIETYAWMRSDKAAELLYKLKNDTYGPIRDAAARELARLGNNSELAPFMAALEDEDEGMRYEAAVLFSKICHPSAADRLAKIAAEDMSVRVRMAALDALKCSPGRKGVADELLKLAEDENPTIMYKAVSALGGIRSSKVSKKLSVLAADSKDLRVRIAAQRGLLEAGEKATLNSARDGLNAASPEIRIEALEIAASFQDSDALPLLAVALDDPDTRVRLYGSLHILRMAERK